MASPFLDRGSYTNGRAVNIAFWSLLSVKTVHVQIFRPVQLVVMAAEGMTGFGFGAFLHKCTKNY